MSKQSLLSISIISFMVLFASNLSAQFILSAEIRPRAEFRNGFKSPIEIGVDPAFFVEQRTRLNANYVTDDFNVVISIQDVRTWGAVGQVYKEDPSLFNVYEAYGTYNISQKHHVSAGRMALNYDNARIIGNLDWAQQGRSHDLLKYSYVAETFKLDVGLAYNQNAIVPEYSNISGTYYSGVNNYKTMQYAWAHKTFDQGGISFLALNSGMQFAPDTIYSSQTFGSYYTANPGNNSLQLEGYYQTGKDPNGRKLSAYLLAASWTFHKNKPVNFTAQFEILSGDNPDTETNETFTPLYGTNHKFYGYMDYFYVGNGHQDKGLVDFNIQARIKSGEKSFFQVTVHQFSAQAAIVDQATTLPSNLGNEIDFVYNIDLAKDVNLMLGYSQMFQTESMDIIKEKTNPKSMQNWAWAMLTFKPTFFDSSKFVRKNE